MFKNFTAQTAGVFKISTYGIFFNTSLPNSDLPTAILRNSTSPTNGCLPEFQFKLINCKKYLDYFDKILQIK